MAARADNTHTRFQQASYSHPALSVSSQHIDCLCTVPLDSALSYPGHLPEMFSHLLAPKLSLTSHTSFQNCSGLCWSFAFSALLQVCNILALSCTHCPVFSLIASYPESTAFLCGMETPLSPEFVPCTQLPHRTWCETGQRVNTQFVD